MVWKLGGIQLVNSLPTLSQAVLSSSWPRIVSRGLSKRLLIFAEFQVY
jgi:hypothetical protein